MARKQKRITATYDKSVSSYFDDIVKYNGLSREEECELWKDYKYNGNIEARNKIVSSNLKFVASVAKYYQGRGLSFSDLIAEGNMGLIRSMDKYDATKGVKVISYSVWWIRQAIVEALNKRNYMDTEDFPDECSKQIESNESMDITPSDCCESMIDDDNIVQKDAKDTVRELMDLLSDREKTIVSLYFGLDGGKPLTLEEVGKEVNLTKERVRQINEKALMKLRSGATNILAGSTIYKK